jgi:hypothetical protein
MRRDGQRAAIVGFSIKPVLSPHFQLAVQLSVDCPGCNDANGGYPWRVQQINCGGNADASCVFKSAQALSDAPAAEAGPFVTTYAEHDQQHFTFKSANGGIWDVFYCPGCNGAKWVSQQLNMGALTGAPAAASGPFVNIYSGQDQQHFAYRTAEGEIWDVFNCPGCSGAIWRAQQLNCGPKSDASCTEKNAQALTDAPAAVDGPVVDTYSEHDQQHFAYLAKGGGVWDIFNCPGCGNGAWQVQLINTSAGTTGGPVAVAAPFVTVYSGHDQQHFVYRDENGGVQDVFYCPGCSGANWRRQQINCGTGSACPAIDASATTAGLPANDGPFVDLYSGHDQLHYAYRDKNGGVQDVFYCPGCSGANWHLQQINAPGLTAGSAAAAAPFVAVYDGHDQQHFAWRDSGGNLWDAYACPGCSDGFWHVQRVTPCGDLMAQMGDLTPNDAPCNAINKIVRGYLQAFRAAPTARGQLEELWNSDETPGEAVRWFAKESPPTIADGKVFMPEFPAKPAEGRWNDSGATGRLVVYGRRR